MKVVINMDTDTVYSMQPVEDGDSALQFLPISEQGWRDFQRVRSEWQRWQAKLADGIQTFKL